MTFYVEIDGRFLVNSTTGPTLGHVVEWTTDARAARTFTTQQAAHIAAFSYRLQRLGHGHNLDILVGAYQQALRDVVTE